MIIPPHYIINTTEESKALDAKTSDEFGIDTFSLMEVAGYSAAKIILDETTSGGKGLFICGKGNNGGDALVAARYLVQNEYEATILFVSGSDELSPLAQKNYELLQKIVQNDEDAVITIINDWKNFESAQKFDFIVDGLLGTGLNSELRGDILQAVQWVNNQQAPCFAMDISTGLHADSGKIMGEAIRVSRTCSFGILKQGFYLSDGFKCRGEVHFCELPFPNYLKSCDTFLIDEEWLPQMNRELPDHKYDAGVVYIIGGSEGLTGAAIMAARSAWAEGVGAVIVVCPHGLLPAFEKNLPEVIKKPAGNRDDHYFKKEHLQEVISVVQEKEGVILIGPGLGREESTVQFANDFLEKTESDCVVDADALWALAQQDDWQHNKNLSHILTPHPGELKTLLGEAVGDDLNRLKKVRETAAAKSVTLMSKGFPAIVGTEKGEIYLSAYDSRKFSRAGFGDVLAGKIAAFKALGCDAEEACIRGLISGEKKMEQLNRQKPDYVPEPNDVM